MKTLFSTYHIKFDFSTKITFKCTSRLQVQKFHRRIRIQIRKDPRAGSGSEMTLQVGSGFESEINSFGSATLETSAAPCQWCKILHQRLNVQILGVQIWSEISSYGNQPPHKFRCSRSRQKLIRIHEILLGRPPLLASLILFALVTFLSQLFVNLVSFRQLFPQKAKMI